MPGPSPQKAVIMPSGTKYNKAIKVVSSTLRKAKKIAVINAINRRERKYRHNCERKEDFCIAIFIIPFRSGVIPIVCLAFMACTVLTHARNKNLDLFLIPSP